MLKQSPENLDARSKAGIFTPDRLRHEVLRIQTAREEQLDRFVVISFGRLFTENVSVVGCAKEHFETDITEEALLLSISSLRRVSFIHDRLHLEYLHDGGPQNKNFPIGVPGLFSFETNVHGNGVTRITSNVAHIDRVVVL